MLHGHFDFDNYMTLTVTKLVPYCIHLNGFVKVNTGHTNTFIGFK